MNMTITETVKLMQQDEELKARGENAMWYGVRAADMTRDELLMFIGMMCETQVFQGGQLAQAARNIETLSAELQAKQ